jgi:cytochrome c oxidase cbb3-type subunit 3
VPKPLLRIVLGVTSLVCVVGAGAFAFSASSCAGPGPARTTDPRLTEGAETYHTYCALCHGENGEGYAADDANALFNQDFLASVSDAFIRTAIVRGHPNTAMSAYARVHGGPLDDEEIDSLVAFIRSKQRGQSATVPERPIGTDLAAAQLTYAAKCAGCHGDRGQGVSALSLDNAVFHESATDGQIRYAIAHGRRGTPMPAFEDELSAAQIDDLVGLIRSFRRERPGPSTNVIPADLPVVINPEGGNPTNFTLREGRFVPSAQVAAALAAGKKLIILDARPPSDFTQLHIPGAVPSPFYAIEEVVTRLPRDGTWIIAYCGCPHAASGHVMDELRTRGFEHTAVLDEGIFVWRDLGHPVEGTSVGAE